MRTRAQGVDSEATPTASHTWVDDRLLSEPKLHKHRTDVGDISGVLLRLGGLIALCYLLGVHQVWMRVAIPCGLLCPHSPVRVARKT